MRPVHVVVMILVCALAVRAGPVEEVQEVAKARAQAYEAGNLDAFMATWAENAVLIPSRSPFRIESKEAIRAYYASIFQNYPIHKLLVRPTMYRTFGDNVVVTNGYQDLVWVDKAGTVTQISLRTSGVWIKLNGKWLMVDYHLSKGP